MPGNDRIAHTVREHNEWTGDQLLTNATVDLLRFDRIAVGIPPMLLPTQGLIMNKIVPMLMAATVIGAFLATPQGHASDHIDAPILAQDHASDLGDTYAFLDPNDPSKVVLIMTTNPFIISSEAIGQAIFDHNLRYRFEIENTGDARPDRFVDVRYSKGLGRLQPQTATITLPNGQSFTAPTTPSSQDDTPPALVVTNGLPNERAK